MLLAYIKPINNCHYLALTYPCSPHLLPPSTRPLDSHHGKLPAAWLLVPLALHTSPHLAQSFPPVCLPSKFPFHSSDPPSIQFIYVLCLCLYQPPTRGLCTQYHVLAASTILIYILSDLVASSHMSFVLFEGRDSSFLYCRYFMQS